jgi:hypothetical protein
LIYAGLGLNPGAPPDLYRQPALTGAALTNALDGHRLFQFPDDEYVVKYERYYTFRSFGPVEYARATREAQVPNTAVLEGLTSANNFDPLVGARYAALTEVVSTTRSVNLLRLMDVSVVASSVPLGWEVVARGGATTFYRVPGDARRAWVVYSARLVTGADAALAALAAPDFDPATTVILEADDAGVHAPASLPPSNSLTAPPNAITIPVLLEQPGWVVLSDTYYPGWLAYVDGQPATLLHGDYAFRAVAVAAGAHTVTFRYAPRSFLYGLWVSSLSGLVCLGVASWLWRSRRILDTRQT